jgi:carbon-monoxide dehydrogenase medium subunit
MKYRFSSVGHLIDVNRIDGLDGIEESGDVLRIGAMVRHNQLAASEVIAAGYQTIAAAAPQIADPLVRNLGTIGGSLAHADPSGDLGSVMLAMDGSVVLRKVGGEREVPVKDFLVGTFTTSIEPDEMLTEVRVPKPAANSGGTYLKLERKVGDYATVAAAVRLTMDNGSIGSAGIGLTSVGLSNIKADAAEEALRGATPGDEAFAEAARLAAEASMPAADVRGSETYKRHMVDVYVRRGLTRAFEMAGAA